ncbi:glycoside hydrolase family 43 protein [Arthrobacter sp. B2a2-09]|uniref:glycoside hydrolase family 43 protein n=1 Tax=Arthrobacter sp. B2a2-09 TaxID=2952822 RepID=UPI0022CD61E9|nr:glycoside hydrolase family 43 protein [Arthrobacter sp. B2a2-09]MCZ9880609.1 glycoside hydrolase family 43 protein [Arthrobacter sp. B2a2-09]
MSITPILPGFHPDPSICRAGEDYYLVASSFEYLPGVPIFHSRDLLHWEQIGSVLDRPEMLSLNGSQGGSGIYAPTIRFHDGRFWMTTTNVNEFTSGHIITSATDPRGPWSIPVHVPEAVGIDPDLVWDDNGTCHITWSAGFGETQIMQAKIDPDSGRLLSPPRRISGGSGLAHAEAPHIFRRGQWWYLLLAEGGTDRGHMVTIARSRSLDGPFENNPANPILTRRSTAHPVQNTGHADFVETPTGEWAVVYLGVRPRGRTPRFHANGRETFLAGVTWRDGWPLIDEDRYTVPDQTAEFLEDFADGVLDPRWIAPGIHPGEITRRVSDGIVVVTPADRPGIRALLAIRPQHPSWTATADLRGSSGRLVIRMDESHWAAVELGEISVDARVVIGPVDTVLASIPRPLSGPVTVGIRVRIPAPGPMGASAPDLVELGVEGAGGWQSLVTVDGRYFTTEVAGGFTGRVVGVEPVTGKAESAVLRSFRYTPTPEGAFL